MQPRKPDITLSNTDQIVVSVQVSGWDDLMNIPGTDLPVLLYFGKIRALLGSQLAQPRIEFKNEMPFRVHYCLGAEVYQAGGFDSSEIQPASREKALEFLAYLRSQLKRLKAQATPESSTWAILSAIGLHSEPAVVFSVKVNSGKRLVLTGWADRVSPSRWIREVHSVEPNLPRVRVFHARNSLRTLLLILLVLLTISAILALI